MLKNTEEYKIKCDYFINVIKFFILKIIIIFAVFCYTVINYNNDQFALMVTATVAFLLFFGTMIIKSCSNLLGIISDE